VNFKLEKAMAIVSLSQAAELTGKSKSVISKALKDEKLKGIKNANGDYEINTNDLFVLFPQKEQDNYKILDVEISKYKEQISMLENKLKDEVLKREALEYELGHRQQEVTLSTMVHTDSNDAVLKVFESLPKNLIDEKILNGITNLVKHLITDLPEITTYNSNNENEVDNILFIYGKVIANYQAQRKQYLLSKLGPRASKEEFRYDIRNEHVLKYMFYNTIPCTKHDTCAYYFIKMIEHEFGYIYKLYVENYLNHE
jgi:hypothetical protein